MVKDSPGTEKTIMKSSGIKRINRGDEQTVAEKRRGSSDIKKKIRYEDDDHMREQDDLDKAQVIPSRIQDQYIGDETKKK